MEHMLVQVHQLLILGLALLPLNIKKNSDFKLLQGVEAGVKRGGEVVGFLKYIKVPFTHVIIFYDFYVKPAWRRKKVGTTLSDAVMKKVLYEEQASYIIVQPGPFELSSEENSTCPIPHAVHKPQ